MDGMSQKDADAVTKALNAVAQKFPNTRAAKRATHLAQVAATKPS